MHEDSRAAARSDEAAAQSAPERDPLELVVVGAVRAMAAEAVESGEDSDDGAVAQGEAQASSSNQSGAPAFERPAKITVTTLFFQPPALPEFALRAAEEAAREAGRRGRRGAPRPDEVDERDERDDEGRGGRGRRGSRAGRGARDDRDERDRDRDDDRDSRDDDGREGDGRQSAQRGGGSRADRDGRDSRDRQGRGDRDRDRDGRDGDRDERGSGSSRGSGRSSSGSGRGRDDRDDRDDRNDRDDEGRSSRSRRRGGNDEPEVITEPQRIRGSTRLEAKRQRRRVNRETGRRRHVVTESEFLARRESVDRVMVVQQKGDQMQIGVMEDSILVEHYTAKKTTEASLIGNVYLGRVQNVLPSMEAAFIDIGYGRNAVLYSGEVDWQVAELGSKPRRIENALKPGDSVLVQVTKDPVGHKGARLTSQISLPGRYLVYVPKSSLHGISRKLPDTERTRLKKILKEALPGDEGVIVRTAAEGASEEQLKRDVTRLMKQWDDIQRRAKSQKAPASLHTEPDLLIKIVRDVFNEDFNKLIIQGTEPRESIMRYLEAVAPDLVPRVEVFEGKGEAFDGYRATEQIDKALERKVWLPSGGSIVIDRTEAMTVVDVNTGKFVGSGGNLEETVTKNNLEAAEEVVRQLRLRDIGGIIVIDFIDMVLETNRDLVLRRLVECLSRDRTKHQVAEVTSLGLVQMTRKKLGVGLVEQIADDNSPSGVDSSQARRTRRRGSDDSGSSNSGSQRSRGSQGSGSSATPHEITEETRSALSKIAQSTILAASGDKTEAEAGAKKIVAALDTAAAGAGSSAGDEDASGTSSRSRRGRKGKRRASSDTPSDQSSSGAESKGTPEGADSKADADPAPAARAAAPAGESQNDAAGEASHTARDEAARVTREIDTDAPSEGDDLDPSRKKRRGTGRRARRDTIGTEDGATSSTSAGPTGGEDATAFTFEHAAKSPAAERSRVTPEDRDRMLGEVLQGLPDHSASAQATSSGASHEGSSRTATTEAAKAEAHSVTGGAPAENSSTEQAPRRRRGGRGRVSTTTVSTEHAQEPDASER